MRAEGDSTDIFRLHKDNRRSLNSLYRIVTAELRRNGIDQWDWMYPNRWTIGSDVKKGTVYGIVEQGEVIGAVAADRERNEKTAGLPWKDRDGDPWSIHRLAVLPERQGQGLGSKLLKFAESRAAAEGGTSIRLEVYAGNPGAVSMYERAGYAPAGETRYPFRKLPYLCYEKMLGDPMDSLS